MHSGGRLECTIAVATHTETWPILRRSDSIANCYTILLRTSDDAQRQESHSQSPGKPHLYGWQSIADMVCQLLVQGLL